MERKYFDDKAYIDDCLTIEIEEGPAEKHFFEEGNYKFKFDDIDSFSNGNDWFKPDKDYFEMNVECVWGEREGEPAVYGITVEVKGMIYHDDPNEKPEPYTFRYDKLYYKINDYQNFPVTFGRPKNK